MMRLQLDERWPCQLILHGTSVTKTEQCMRHTSGGKRFRKNVCCNHNGSSLQLCARVNSHFSREVVSDKIDQHIEVFERQGSRTVVDSTASSVSSGAMIGYATIRGGWATLSVSTIACASDWFVSMLLSFTAIGDGSITLSDVVSAVDSVSSDLATGSSERSCAASFVSFVVSF